MANRIPLIVNPTASQIQELPTGDKLLLSGHLEFDQEASGCGDIISTGGDDAIFGIFNSKSVSSSSKISIIGRNNNNDGNVSIATFDVGADDTPSLSVAVPSGRTPIVSNTPAFKAKLSGNQSITSNLGNTVNTEKVEFATEEFDSDNRYNNTASTVNGIPAYSFKPDVAGFYFVSASTSLESSADRMTFARVQIYKNTDVVSACITETKIGQSSPEAKEFTQTTSTIVEMNGTSDTLHVQTDGHTNNDGTIILNSTTFRNYFFAYKLII